MFSEQFWKSRLSVAVGAVWNEWQLNAKKNMQKTLHNQIRNCFGRKKIHLAAAVTNWNSPFQVQFYKAEIVFGKSYLVMILEVRAASTSYQSWYFLHCHCNQTRNSAILELWCTVLTLILSIFFISGTVIFLIDFNCQRKKQKETFVTPKWQLVILSSQQPIRAWSAVTCSPGAKAAEKNVNKEICRLWNPHFFMPRSSLLQLKSLKTTEKCNYFEYKGIWLLKSSKNLTSSY